MVHHDLPRGSQYPTGGSAPGSPSKDIFKAVALEMRPAGEKAAAERIEARTTATRNIFKLRKD